MKSYSINTQLSGSDIDFDAQLALGIAAYNDRLGRWWLSRSQNQTHRRAYHRIAKYVEASFSRPPGLIIDYACGPGSLLQLLAIIFPSARLIGLDGSRFLLERAQHRLSSFPHNISQRMSLIETTLPNFKLKRWNADLAIFAFPNMVASSAGPSRISMRYLMPSDKSAAKTLSAMGSRGEPRETEDPHTVYYSLLRNRLISYNLRQMLKRGAICVRVEYGSMRRHEHAKPDLMRIAFEEGSLDVPVGKILPASWFRVLASAYFRSGAIEDVYQQTGDESDRRGGYLITSLRAL